MSNTVITVEGREVATDENGNVSLFIPLAEQKQHYTVSVPFSNDIYTIYMPCGEYNAILIE